MRGEVQGYLKARHDVSCAIYDPSPGQCDCEPTSTPLVLQKDFLTVKFERDIMIEVVETLLPLVQCSTEDKKRIQQRLSDIRLKDL